MVALLAAALLAAPAPQASTATVSSLERSVLVDINALRAQHHLATLRLNVRLSAAAHAHTQQMAADGYFAHESADGTSFWKRVQSFYTSLRWRYWSVGENLLWSSPDVDAAGALKLWL